MPLISTFSIVAFDPDRAEWGVAVQSRYFAVGSVVPWARATAGAVATQSHANLTYGPHGLDLMASGVPAEETIERLIETDEDRGLRQVGVVDREGHAAAYTGDGCQACAEHIVGESFTCQGNILVSGTVGAMAKRFERARGGPGELADWIIEAMIAGQQAGGDRRGRQAAALLVVRDGAGRGGYNDRYMDLRVDDNPHPIRELQRLLERHHFYFGEVDPADLIPLADIAAEVQEMLSRTGHYEGPTTGVFDEATRRALYTLVDWVNLECRWNGKTDLIDKTIVEALRDMYGR